MLYIAACLFWMEHVFSDTVACSFLPESPGASGSCLGASLCVFVEDRPADTTDSGNLPPQLLETTGQGSRQQEGWSFHFRPFTLASGWSPSCTVQTWPLLFSCSHLTRCFDQILGVEVYVYGSVIKLAAAYRQHQRE